MRDEWDQSAAQSRRALLAARLRQVGSGAGEMSIPRASRGDLAPMSFSQERMWFLHQYDPDQPTYNCPMLVYLHGPLDRDALRSAIELIVTRHEALRTTFTLSDGSPMQRIGPPGPVALPVEDVSGLPEGERAAAIERITRQFARAPFDLQAGPVIRFLLLRLADEAHALVVVAHHAVWDGWSRGVLLRELGLGYQELAAGRRPALPELPLQYADYAIWQRERLRGERIEELTGWWRDYLAGAPTTSEMPTDRPRPPLQTHSGARVHFRVSAEVSAAVRRLGQAADCTLFMTLLAAWGALMHRYTGQDDLVVGGPVAAREPLELEELIGCLVNALVFRLDLAGD
ncbi:MAG TPA: condensation domain-containing protein, partial [Armatimonadota bacterium]|nr:condensation domain-containing protein [Armatimonadota bacterium]